MTIESPQESDRTGGAPHPRWTEALFGQKQAETNFLDSFTSGRLLHAWLITGPRGVGKATLAWRIAKFLLSDPPSCPKSLDSPTGHPAISRIHALTDPSIYLVRRRSDPKSGRHLKDISVEEIRDLKSYFGYASADHRHRVAIIDSADDMNDNAANALLKLLEEPPEKTVFILVSHSPSILLPTIRSRCAVLRCRPLDKIDFARALESLEIGSPKRRRELSELAGGSIGEAVRIAGGGGLEIYSRLIGLFGNSPGFQRSDASAIAARCDAPGTHSLTAGLIATMIRRLALTGLGKEFEFEAADGEFRVLKLLAADQSSSRAWAQNFHALTRRAEMARNLNAEPYTAVLEMLLAIDRTVGELTGARI